MRGILFTRGKVPETCRGLARYLAKYVASPPIAVRIIISYDGRIVKYWYQDHKSKSKKFESVVWYNTFCLRDFRECVIMVYKRRELLINRPKLYEKDCNE